MAEKYLKGVHYSQQSREAEPFLFNKGEDALPFVCDSFMLVADGLGGDGCFVHTRMNPEMWDREARRRLFEVPDDDEALSAYFDGLFAEMDRDAVDGKKPERYDRFPRHELHSGYFGSRLAAYCFVTALRRNEQFDPERLFQALDAAETGEQRQACLDRYASELCDLLDRSIRELAKRGGFELESDELDAKLLPTTLAAALYRDVGDETQVICLWAGDSRIVAQLEDGCVQLTEDDEKNEGMTNLIFLGDRFKFHLNIREYRFKRPFALLAVSDGTFDDMGGSLSFEALVVLNAMDCDGPEAMERTWQELLTPPRSTDDSATIAYCFFGMEDMEASRRFVAPRIQEISEKYVEQLPELFDEDYAIELQRLMRGAKNRLRPFQEEIRSDPHVLETFIEDEKRDPSPELKRRLRDIQDSEKRLDAQANDVHRAIRTFYQRHWEDLRPHSSDPDANDTARRLRAALSDMATCRAKYADKLSTILKEAESRTGALAGLIAQGLAAAEKGILSCSPLGIQEDDLRQVCRGMKGLLDELKAFARVREGEKAWLGASEWEKLSGDYSALSKRADDLRQKLFSAEDAVLVDIVKRAEAEEDPEAVAQLPPEVRAKKERLRELADQRAALEEARNEAIAAAARLRAEKSMGSILDDLLYDKGLLERLSEELRGKLEGILGEVRQRSGELEAKSRLQKEIFEACDQRYMRFIQGE